MSWPSGDSFAPGGRLPSGDSFAPGSFPPVSSSAASPGAAASAGAMPADQGGRDGTPRMCSVDLPDGSPCPDLAVAGSSCERHADVADRDFQVFQEIHDHFQQELREFWQRSNFYLVVDGVLGVRLRHVARPCPAAHPVLRGPGHLAVLAAGGARQHRLTGIMARRNPPRGPDRQPVPVVQQIEGRLQRKPWLSPSWLTQWLPACFLASNLLRQAASNPAQPWNLRRIPL